MPELLENEYEQKLIHNFNKAHAINYMLSLNLCGLCILLFQAFPCSAPYSPHGHFLTQTCLVHFVYP